MDHRLWNPNLCDKFGKKEWWDAVAEDDPQPVEQRLSSADPKGPEDDRAAAEATPPPLPPPPERRVDKDGNCIQCKRGRNKHDPLHSRTEKCKWKDEQPWGIYCPGCMTDKPRDHPLHIKDPPNLCRWPMCEQRRSIYSAMPIGPDVETPVSDPRGFRGGGVARSG